MQKKIFLFVLAIVIGSTLTLSPIAFAQPKYGETKAGFWYVIHVGQKDNEKWLLRRVLEHEKKRKFYVIRKHIDIGTVRMLEYGIKVRIKERDTRYGFVLIEVLDTAKYGSDQCSVGDRFWTIQSAIKEKN